MLGGKLQICVAAHGYLKNILNGKTTLSVKAGKAGRDKLTAGRKALNQGKDTWCVHAQKNST